MTEASRVVLDDCRAALADLREQVGGEAIHGDKWRRRWVTVVVLLRIVGDVLRKLDAGQSDEYKQAIDEAWKRLNADIDKPEDAVFQSFIEEDRNLIVKEYRFRAGQDHNVHVPMGVVNLATGEQSQVGASWIEHTGRITDGPFAGRLATEVIAEAIDWWRKYLDDIDRAAKKP
jgi:hypothetical protein